MSSSPSLSSRRPAQAMTNVPEAHDRDTGGSKEEAQPDIKDVPKGNASFRLIKSFSIHTIQSILNIHEHL